MKKESSDEAVRNQYVSENEYLKSSINRASLGRSGRPSIRMQGSGSHEKQENTVFDGGSSGNGGLGSVMDHIRKYKNGDNDSSSDDDNNNDVDVDVDDGRNDDDDDDDDDDDEKLDKLELEEEGDSIDNSVREEMINNRKKAKVISENKVNGNIIKIENSVEKDIKQVEDEEIDGVKNTPLSRSSPYKSILEEFEEMENENENMDNMEMKNIRSRKFSTTEIEDDSEVEVEVEISPLVKLFPTPEENFEYIDNAEEKDNNEIDGRMSLEKIFPEIKNSLKNEISSNLEFLNQLDGDDSDDLLLLHRNNVDDVLQNLLEDFKININSKISKKKTNKNVTSKSELKNTKKDKKSSVKKKLMNRKESKLSHSSLIASVNDERKKESKKNHFLSDKKKSSTQMIFQAQVEDKEGLSINHFNSIFSHKKTILCFTLAITIHYFIFSGISKLV